MPTLLTSRQAQNTYELQTWRWWFCATSSCTTTQPPSCLLCASTLSLSACNRWKKVRDRRRAIVAHTWCLWSCSFGCSASALPAHAHAPVLHRMRPLRAQAARSRAAFAAAVRQHITHTQTDANIALHAAAADRALLQTYTRATPRAARRPGVARHLCGQRRGQQTRPSAGGSHGRACARGRQQLHARGDFAHIPQALPMPSASVATVLLVPLMFEQYEGSFTLCWMPEKNCKSVPHLRPSNAHTCTYWPPPPCPPLPCVAAA
jgi:hypothetical protein